MANKTKLKVTYDDETEEEVQIASSGALTENLTTLKAVGVNGYVQLIQLTKGIDSFLRANDITKLEYEEEEE